MKELILWEIEKKYNKKEKIVIVGAGHNGKQIADILQKKGFYQLCFFDNNIVIQGNNEKGIDILKPKRIEGECIYILSPEEPYRSELYSQLININILDKDIFTCSLDICEYHRKMSKECYQEEISRMFREIHGYDMDWNFPKTYSEKINWEKLNEIDSRKTKLADKYLVRAWVRNMIGEKYLTRLYGVWTDAKNVDFSALPSSFVLKVNNGSGRNIIVKNKKKINLSKVINQLDLWMKNNYFFMSFERQYKDIVPVIICEEYLKGLADNSDKIANCAYDYKIYCFHGTPKYIECIRGSHVYGGKSAFYTTDWEKLPLSYGYLRDELHMDRPEKLCEMLEISKILSQSFKHVRVDLYNLPDGRILFGEMTFSTWSGLRKFTPLRYDRMWGRLIESEI